jgi:hypothetical protein
MDLIVVNADAHSGIVGVKRESKAYTAGVHTHSVEKCMRCSVLHAGREREDLLQSCEVQMHKELPLSNTLPGNTVVTDQTLSNLSIE